MSYICETARRNIVVGASERMYVCARTPYAEEMLFIKISRLSPVTPNFFSHFDQLGFYFFSKTMFEKDHHPRDIVSDAEFVGTGSLINFKPVEILAFAPSTEDIP